MAITSSEYSRIFEESGEWAANEAINRSGGLLLSGGAVVNMFGHPWRGPTAHYSSGIQAGTAENMLPAQLDEELTVPTRHVPRTVVEDLVQPPPFEPGGQMNVIETGSPREEPMVTRVSMDEPGADLRDIQGFDGVGPLTPVSVAAVGPVIALSRLLVLIPIFGGRIVSWLARFATGTTVRFNSLPGWMRAAMTAVGLGGTAILIDEVTEGGLLPFGPSGGGDDLVHISPHMVDGHLGAHVVGSWEANGVTFYRLSDGKLAVQNKHGRWKVWKPKRPIVIMPGGANKISTILKADRVLNKQAKQIASMLNRRAPRAKRASKTTDVIGIDGRITQIKN